MPTSGGCQDAGLVLEHGRNVRAGERKFLHPWEGLSLNYSLDPKGSSKKGAGSELERVTWSRRVRTQSTQKADHNEKLGLGTCGQLQESSPECPAQHHCSNLLASYLASQAQRWPMQGPPPGQCSPPRVGPDDH